MASIDYLYGLEESWEDRRLRYLRSRKSSNKFERPQERFFVAEQEGNPHPVLIKTFSCDSAPLNRAGKAQTKVSNKVRTFRAWTDNCESLGLRGKADIGQWKNTKDWWICACKKTRCQGGPP